MVKQEKFSWDTIRDFIDIGEHMLFAESLMAKYRWDVGERAGLMAQLDKIKAKQNDQALNLSVIGEFSTGKSSFINALLGQQLLVSSVIQGTTVVNTVIEYNSKLCVCVCYKDGRNDVQVFSSVSDLSGALSKITTNNAMAKNIKEVRVGIPSQLLMSGIRIIDTPGTNSLESWHEDVTRKALRDLSDLSIVLVDGMHPLTQTLMDFVEENLSDIYSQCAFVVTYYDAIPLRERASVLGYISTRLSFEMGIERPLVLPYVSPAVMARNTGQQFTDRDALAQLSDRSAETIFKYMAGKRQIAQIKKVLSLTTDAFTMLDNGIKRKKKNTEKELDKLNKSRQADLSVFVAEQKQQRVTSFLADSKWMREEVKEQCSEEKEKAIGRLVAMIRKQKDVDSLKKFLKEELGSKCAEEARKVAGCSAGVQDKLRDLYVTIIKKFQGEFEKKFKELDILAVGFDAKGNVIDISSSLSLSNLREATNYVSQESFKENAGTVGAWALAITGASIGSAIPVVGTVIGGAIGFLLGGLFFMPDTEKVIAKTIEKVKPQLRSYFAITESDVMTAFDEYTYSIAGELKKEIDKYLSKYRETVDSLIIKQKARLTQLENEMKMASDDLKIINIRKQQLLSASDRITLYINENNNRQI